MDWIFVFFAKIECLICRAPVLAELKSWQELASPLIILKATQSLPIQNVKFCIFSYSKSFSDIITSLIVLIIITTESNNKHKKIVLAHLCYFLKTHYNSLISISIFHAIDSATFVTLLNLLQFISLMLFKHKSF